MKKVKQYQYPAMIRWFNRILTALAFITPFYVFTRLFTTTQIPDGQSLLILIGYGLLVVIYLLATLLMVANYHADVTSDTSGLLVNFLWWKCKLAWHEIREIKPSIYMWDKVWVVRTTGLTQFHRLYGLIYGFTLSPSFVITSLMLNYQELIQRVEIHIKRNQGM